MNRPEGMVPWWVPHLSLYGLAAFVVYIGITPSGIGLLLSMVGMGQALWAPIPFLVAIVACSIAVTIAGMLWRVAVGVMRLWGRLAGRRA